MAHCFQPGRAVRVQRTLLVAAVVGVLAGAGPDRALAASGPNLATMGPEFNRICSDLARAREELQSGALSEEAFSDRILSLFVVADSLRYALSALGPSVRRPGSPFFAMDRGLRYLIDSLRENYVGIVARNGVSFVAADRALQAAVAWRSGASAGSAVSSDLDVVRP